MNGSTWMNRGSVYIVVERDGLFILTRIIQVEPIVSLPEPEMIEFLKNFTCINRG